MFQRLFKLVLARFRGTLTHARNLLVCIREFWVGATRICVLVVIERKIGDAVYLEVSIFNAPIIFRFVSNSTVLG